MNLNELEKNLKDFRPVGKVKINTEDLWNRVQPHIPQNRRRKWFIPFISFLLLTFIGIWGYSIFSINSSSAEVNTETQSVQKIETKQNLVSSGSAKNISSFTKDNNNRLQAGSFNSVESQQEDLIIDATETIEPKNDKPLNSPSSLNKVQHVQKQIVQSTTQVSTTPVNPGKLSKEQFALNKSESNKVITLVTSTTSEQKPSQESNPLLIQNATQVPTQQKSVNNTIESSDLITSEANASRANFSFESIDNKVLMLDDYPEEPSIAPKRINPFVFRQHPKLTLEIAGSYLSPQKEFNLTQSEFENEFESRNTAEEILEAWHASAQIRYNLNPRFGISMGVQYGMINERSSKALSYSESIQLTDTIVGNLVRIDGTVDPIYGDIEIDRTIMKNVSRINSYKYIQMPIEIFYTQPVNRLNFELGAGIIQNISFTSQGYWHPDTKTEYDLSTDKSSYLKSRLGLSVTGRAGLGYDITNGIGVFAHGRYIKHLSGITNSNYGIQHRYSMLGAEVGLRFHLF